MPLTRVFFGVVALFLSCTGLSYGADATTFDPTKILVVSKSTGGGVPVGSIVAWPSYGNPDDANKWLECNGQSTAGYPELAAVVGGTVPDYRGLFLRGYGSQASYHYGAVTHASAGLGVLQGDSIRDITGGFVADDSQIGTGWAGAPPYGSFSVGARMGYDMGSESEGGGGYLHFSASATSPTANEDRPVNKAVRYLIRAAK